MIEFYKLATHCFWHFIGVFILTTVILQGLASIIKESSYKIYKKKNIWDN